MTPCAQVSHVQHDTGNGQRQLAEIIAADLARPWPLLARPLPRPVFRLIGLETEDAQHVVARHQSLIYRIPAEMKKNANEEPTGSDRN
jgi:hypothetical protein